MAIPRQKKQIFGGIMLTDDTVTVSEEVHTPHSHMKHSGHSWLDKIVPISAILISLTSIVISIHHGQIMQEMARTNYRAASASVWPHLSVSLSNNENGKPVHTIKIQNTGIGPARLESFQVLYDGKPTRNFINLLVSCCNARLLSSELTYIPPEASTSIAIIAVDEIFLKTDESRPSNLKITTSSAAPNVIGANESIELVRWEPASSNDPLWISFEKRRLDVQLKARACYCSVFEECWITEFDSNIPTPVANCQKEEIQFQQAP